MARAAFNVFDFDTVRAIGDAAASAGEKTFLQFSSSTVSYYGAETLAELIRSAARHTRGFLLVHLDHCNDFNVIESCLNNGWDSIMADFSHLPLQENISMMNDVKKLLGNREILLEGELGQVAGVEDGQGADGGSLVHLEDVCQFVSETEVDLLAVGIGNAHGFYTTTDCIDIDLLREVHSKVPKQKLVLHGGSGVETEKIFRMIRLGVEKINISTELKHGYVSATSAFLEGPDAFNMTGLVQSRYEAVRTMAEKKILQFKTGRLCT